jgi:hypothetical protein
MLNNIEGRKHMKKYYANLVGEWIDITENATVSDYQDPKVYFKECLEDLSKYDYINIQYNDKNYRIHSSLIQVVTE